MAITEKEIAKKIIASRKLITTPGKYEGVKVTNVNPYINSERNQVAIANFAAMTEYHYTKAIDDFRAGDLDAACNHNLSVSIRKNDYMPSKGELVDIVVEEVATKTGEIGLFVTSVTPMKATKASTINMNAFGDAVENHVDSPEVAVAVPAEFAPANKK